MCYTKLTVTVLSISLLISGCSARRAARDAATPPVPPQPGTYIDLEPGWRLAVVTPLLRSGKYVLPEVPTQTSAQGTSLEITLSAGSDFIGYERSYYAVVPRRGGGVQVRFTSAESHQDGKVQAAQQPVVKLFDLPRSARHIRLVYLVRVSTTDHNMAIIGTPDVSTLDEVTRQVQTAPAEGCRAPVCQWVPPGIAVRPEKQREGSEGWTPAR